MAAVRVPPSACRTSQSSTIVFSPRAFVSTTARRLRPTSREISWVRPPMRPLTDSRSERVLVARGSIAYSAVTQPSPLPLRQRGTPSVKDAAHSTRVRPNSTRTLPSAWSSQLRVILMSRSWSVARPSCRVMRPRLGGALRRRTQGYSSYVASGEASSTSPGQTAPAWARQTSGSFHGGRWVSISRWTPPAPTAARAARLPERWMPSTASRPSTNAESARTSVASRHSGARAVAGVGVAGVGQGAAAGLDPQPVGLDRVVDQERRDPERADLEPDAVLHLAEVQLGAHVLGVVQVVGPRHPAGDARRPVHGHGPRVGAARGRTAGRRTARTGPRSGRGAGG